jgi:hypothetical protein
LSEQEASRGKKKNALLACSAVMVVKEMHLKSAVKSLSLWIVGGEEKRDGRLAFVFSSFLTVETGHSHNMKLPAFK